MAGAVRRVPAIADAGVSRMINGPEGFTPGQRVHPRRERRSAGSSSPPGSAPTGSPAPAGSAARSRRWIVDGEPELDLWHMDIRRFGGAALAVARVDARPDDRGLRDLLRHPLPERGAPGGPAAADVADVRAARGARRGLRREVRLGAAELVRAERRRPALRRSDALEASGRAAGPASTGARRSRPRRSRRGRPSRLFDETSFAKIEVVGPGAVRVPRAAVRERRRRPGRADRLHLDAELARRDRVRPDGDPRRAGPLPARHRDGVRQPRPRLAPEAPARRRLASSSTTSRRAASASGCGARAPATSSRRSRPTTSRTTAFPYLTARAITVGRVPVLALRVTYVGELGWELYAHAEYGAALWDTLWEAGREHGLVAGRLPGDRRAPAREGLPRLVERHHARRDAVRGRPRVRGRASTRRPSSSAARRSSRRRPPARGSGCAASSSTTRARSASATSRSGSAARSSAGSRPAATATPSSGRSPTPTCRPTRRSGRAARSTSSASGSGSRWRASRSTTRPASGCARERRGRGRSAPAWSAALAPRAGGGARRVARARPRGLRRGRRDRPARRSGATSRSRRSPTGRS